MRRVPRKVVARSSIAYVRYGYIHLNISGQLRDESGKVLMVIEPTVTRKQIVALAEELGVPLRR